MNISPRLVHVSGVRACVVYPDPTGKYLMHAPGPAEIRVFPLGGTPRADAHARKVFDYLKRKALPGDTVTLCLCTGEAETARRRKSLPR